jgi:exodeoxyribonuclease-3
MRLVAWNCGMALHRKMDALLQLEPDVAVVCECAEPGRLRAHGTLDGYPGELLWVGNNPHKGLAVLAFNGYSAQMAEEYMPSLRYIAPVHVSGPAEFNLLAVWAQIGNGTGSTRTHQLGPLRRALSRYREFMTAAPAIVAGDLNNNVFWDRPGRRSNHLGTVDRLERLGLVSAYHAMYDEQQGEESIPTIYWRDRKKDGPTYHIDYVFIPRGWIEHVRDFAVGTFEDWCGSGLSDHVPLVVDLAVEAAGPEGAARVVAQAPTSG